MTVHSDVGKIVAYRFGGGSYQSTSDPRLHIGLGASNKPMRIEITWPSGTNEGFENVSPNAFYRIREGSGAIEKLERKR